MKLLKIVKSDEDATLKYIFQTEEKPLPGNKSGKSILEFSYINKNDGKNIICVPSQTMCNLGCKFCHTTDYIGKIPVRGVYDYELLQAIKIIHDDLKFMEDPKVLLISFMGCGEPILNVDNVINTMIKLQELQKTGEIVSPYIRFAIATSIPKFKWENFFILTDGIKKNNLPVKVHFSLHYTIDVLRNEWMNSSLDILPSLSAMDFYRKITGNAVEIHYALIEGVNDTEQDAILLSEFLKDKDFNVKFLFYNERPTLNVHASNKNKLAIFKRYFDKHNIKHEYYIPPGLSIGSSCGAFLMDYYLEFDE